MFDLDLPARRISFLARTRLLPWLDRLLRGGWQAGAQRTSARALERVLERLPYAALLLSGLGIQRAVPAAAPVPHELRRSQAPLPQVAPESLIRQLEGGGEWQSRVHAARALAHLESPEVIDVLICALRDPSAEVAAAVVDALAAKQAPRVGDVLQQVLSNSDGYFSSITRAAALSALARRAEMTRVFAAVHDLDAAVSVAAIAAIAEHAPRDASAILMPVLRDRSSYFLPLTRVAAARALATSGALPQDVVQELLATEQDEMVRAALQRGA